MAPRLSGLQIQVMRLYKSYLRQCRVKVNDPHCKLTSNELPIVRRGIRAEFEKHRDISKKDFMRIEFLIRSGENQLKNFKNPSVTGISHVG